MKFLVLLCVLAYVSAEGFSSGDLSISEVPFEEVVVTADKKPEGIVSHGPKRKLEHRAGLKPDHRSKALLMGLEDININDNAQTARFTNETVSEEELVSMLRFALGENWGDFYELPSEELSLLEIAQLAVELNEKNFQDAHARNAREDPHKIGDFGGNKSGRGPGTCFCHGTAHHYVTEQEANPSPGNNPDFKDYPYWGVRLFKAGNNVPHGHNNGDGTSHNENPYGPVRDCVLTRFDDWEYSYHSCCSGFCVLTEGATDTSYVDTLNYCENTGDYIVANNFPCSAPECDLSECTCDELTVAIQNECTCEERVEFAHAGCSCEVNGAPWENLGCDCEELLNGVSPYDEACTCEEAVENRGCTCDDGFQYMEDQEFGLDCQCSDLFSAGIKHECTCDQALNLCDGDCCEFYGKTDDHCDYNIHASWIGEEVVRTFKTCGNCP